MPSCCNCTRSLGTEKGWILSHYQGRHGRGTVAVLLALNRLRQGLSYRAQFCPVTVTKMWTTYSQNKKMYYATKKFLTSRAFHPCITLVVQTDWKLAKKSVEVKKSPQNGTFSHHPISGSCHNQT